MPDPNRKSFDIPLWLTETVTNKKRKTKWSFLNGHFFFFSCLFGTSTKSCTNRVTIFSIALCHEIKLMTSFVGVPQCSDLHTQNMPDSEGNWHDWADWRLAGKAAIISGLRLGRAKFVFGSLRHYLRAQSQGHHTIDRLEETGVERGSARRSSLKGRERVIVNQTNTETVSKAKLGTFLRDGVECIIKRFSKRINTVLNWT